MLESWQPLLSSIATIDAEEQRKLGLHATVVSPFTDTAIYAVSGSDATGFLQGQLTFDVTEVNSTHSRSGGWCSAKGRVQTTMRLLVELDDRPDAGYQALLPADHAIPIMQQLQRFVLRAKVAIQPLGNRLCFGLSGADAPAWIEATFGTAPAEINTVIVDTGGCVVRLPADPPRFFLTAPMLSLAPLWRSASRSFPVVGSAAWRMLDILAGVITIDAARSNQYLPQMINLNRYRGISYTKGCYIGQEVIARTYHLGRLKRRAFRVRVDAAAPNPGDSVYTAQADNASVVGNIIESQPLPDNISIAHAILRIDQAQSKPLRLGSAAGPTVTVDEPLIPSTP